MVPATAATAYSVPTFNIATGMANNMSRNAEPPTAAVTPTNIAGNSGSPMPSALVIPIAAYSPTVGASSTTHRGSSRAIRRTSTIPTSEATTAMGRYQ